MNANYFWSLLILFLDAYCLLITVITWHVHRAIFGVPIWLKIMRLRSCVGLKGSVGMGNSMMQTQPKLGAFGTDVMHGFSGRNSVLQVLCFVISLST